MEYSHLSANIVRTGDRAWAELLINEPDVFEELHCRWCGGSSIGSSWSSSASQRLWVPLSLISVSCLKGRRVCRRKGKWDFLAEC